MCIRSDRVADLHQQVYSSHGQQSDLSCRSKRCFPGKAAHSFFAFRK
uniref:Uncharacterized protein n=1 Tax=Anguilla anguilla TaxID=7936 RepID=A0A0E9U086_ANGAN